MITRAHQSFLFRIVLSVILCGILFTSPDAFAKRTHHSHHHAVKKAPPPPAWYADHDRAVELARQGDNAAALPILYNLYQQHSNDAGVVRDYLAVLSWTGGYDQQVISLYKSLPPDQPDYVLEAVGHSYLQLKQYNDAIAIYQYGLARSPGNETNAVGLIRAETDAGYAERAMMSGDTFLAQNGDRFDVLIASGYAAEQFDQAPRALQYYQRAMNLSPNNAEAVRGVVRMQDRMGNFTAGIQTSDAHPGIVTADEYRHLQGSEAAELVRQGSDAPTQAQRYEITDRAIARLNALIQQWSNDPDAKGNLIRARLDRIIAMRNRNMMQDVIREYNAMQQEGISIPPYVISSVGDAYMQLHEPEKARDIFVEVLKVDPKNYDVRRQLFYAYIECGDYQNAFRVIDDLANDQPYWASVTQPNQIPNPRQVSAELTSASARLFSGQVGEADERIRPIAAKYPNMAYSHEVLGNLYDAHGWHRAALDQYAIGSNLGHKDIYNQVGLASQNMALQHYPESEAITKELAQRDPDNLAVQRSERDWQVHNMAELRVNAGYQFAPDTATSVNGGEGFGIDAMLFSSPIDYNWRIYGGEYFAHQKEPNAEGKIDFSRTTIGGEYRNGPWVASGGPTFNHYGDTSDRLGLYGEGSYSINDQWTVAGSGELFSRDTPLRALNSGTTASAVNAHAVWSEDEARSLRFGGSVMPFSDGNTRTGLSGDYAQRLYTIPYFSVDGLVDAAKSQNTADTNRTYYNPGRDFIALLGARATQVLYQRYTNVWSHSFTITPGAYWEEHYGTDAALRMRYEHRLRLDQVFEAGAGVNFNRQSYDGSAENDVSLTMDLVGRF